MQEWGVLRGLGENRVSGMVIRNWYLIDTELKSDYNGY